MSVGRITANLFAPDPGALAAFYRAAFGLDLRMDGGFIVTLGAGTGPVLLSLACEGGSDTPLPHVSIEVEDLDATLAVLRGMAADIAYGPVTEPWGVRRFYLRDPAGNLVNVLSHS
jgi:catechol 2,3-dioxygenase-like lactoylglutathione lyase family enzyme